MNPLNDLSVDEVQEKKVEAQFKLMPIAASVLLALLIQPLTTLAEAPQSAFSPKDHQFTCDLGGESRLVEVDYTDGSGLPCTVFYEKQGQRERLWEAKNELEFCASKAQSFIAKLEGFGWHCELDLPASAQSQDNDPTPTVNVQQAPAPTEQQAEVTDDQPKQKKSQAPQANATQTTEPQIAEPQNTLSKPAVSALEKTPVEEPNQQQADEAVSEQGQSKTPAEVVSVDQKTQ